MRRMTLFSLLAAALLAGGFNRAAGQTVFTMQIIADNDFVVFAGTSNAVTRLVYQNTNGWPDQLVILGNFTFTLEPGETKFYLLGMGGGGPENISGTINGVELTRIPVVVSSDVGPWLTGYQSVEGYYATQEGFFDVILSDVQAALPSLVWSDASSRITTGEYVISQSPNGIGFYIETVTANLFMVDAEDLAVSATPGWPLITYPLNTGSVNDIAPLITGTTASGIEITNVIYSLNGAPWTAATTADNWTNWSTLENVLRGTNTLSVYSVDVNGTVRGPRSIVFTWQPRLDITYPADNSLVFAETLTARGTVTGDSAVTNVFYSYNGAAWSPAVTTDNWVNWSVDLVVPLGTNTFSAYAVDSQGNVLGTNTVVFVRSPLSIVHTFNDDEGENPQGNLVVLGNSIYGTMVYGCDEEDGSVFRVDVDGGDFVTLSCFVSEGGGSRPYGGLVESGGQLFGTRRNSGFGGNGDVFTIATNGSAIPPLYSFSGDMNGGSPEGSLVFSGGKLYGTTKDGGTNGSGVIFSINTNGTGYVVLHRFAGSMRGALPEAGLVIANGRMYGTTTEGGTAGVGIVFAINTDGSRFRVLHEFAGEPDGAYPAAHLVISGNTLYGVAREGGEFNDGTVFSLKTDGSAFTRLHSFADEIDGRIPQAALLIVNGTLVGTTYRGGPEGAGTVFALTPDGSAFTNWYNFTGGDDGRRPWSPLVRIGDRLYGSTWSGGAEGNGTIYSVPIPSLAPANVFYTTSTRSVETTIPVTTKPKATNYSSRVLATMPGGTVVYDQTYPTRLLSDALRAEIALAAESLTNAGATGYRSARTRFSHVLQERTSTTETNLIGTRVTIATNTTRGPRTVYVGTNQADTLVLQSGQSNIDTLFTIRSTNRIVTTVASSYLDSSVYSINGVVASASLIVNATSAPYPAVVGTPLTYTITVTNPGPTTATEIILANTLPPRVTFVSATASQGSATNSGRLVNFRLGDILPGQIITLTIVGIPNAPGLLEDRIRTTGSQADLFCERVTNSTPAVRILSTNLTLTILSDMALDLQTGLFQQVIQVGNVGPDVPEWVRVLISGLPGNAMLNNADGRTNGIPFVESLAPLPVGSNVVFSLEYYARRRIPQPALTVQGGPAIPDEAPEAPAP